MGRGSTGFRPRSALCLCARVPANPVDLGRGRAGGGSAHGRVGRADCAGPSEGGVTPTVVLASMPHAASAPGQKMHIQRVFQDAKLRARGWPRDPSCSAVRPA